VPGVKLSICAVAILAVAAPASGAARWRVQYFYDQDKSVLNFVDMQFPSATRGVAVGFIQEGTHQKPISVVTSDSGRTWQTADLPEMPVSLFFLNEGLGWLATAKGGLWKTTEVGKNWQKMPRIPAAAFKVYFTSENNGWAACVKKKVFQTADGGRTWTPVAAAAEPPGNPEYSVYSWIAFATPQFGIVTGFNLPPRRRYQSVPDWVDPEEALTHRDTPHLSYQMVTHDGGKTWKSNAASLFGAVARIRLDAQGSGLGLIEYSASFRYPSEVYKIDWRTGKNQTVFRDRRLHITDVAVAPDGTAYIAGIAVTGQIRDAVPGKVHILTTRDYVTWSEMDVDYKAAGNRVVLALPDKDNLYLATDGGMVLKLVP
jgi:photosystem II stability/assembly factor-like uncharacterized protein